MNKLQTIVLATCATILAESSRDLTTKDHFKNLAEIASESYAQSRASGKSKFMAGIYASKEALTEDAAVAAGRLILKVSEVYRASSTRDEPAYQ